MSKRPDLDELLEDGRPLWAALEAWVNWPNPASRATPPASPDSDLSDRADKPNTRRH